MAERKREGEPASVEAGHRRILPGFSVNGNKRTLSSKQSPTTLQIIVGTYEKVLHGLTVAISEEKTLDPQSSQSVAFTDTFLFNAHGSAIRCLALSPHVTESQKVILASGGTDERINLYHISASVSKKNQTPFLPTLAGANVMENPKNRELGSLLHHSASISALYFPTRSKLLSAAEDNTVGITRTRDWTLLSTIKAPIPKAVGRPSGDTAPLGGTPAGFNDIALHPTMKLMISVGKGENCMRLWNLVTGKKAGVLNFERDLLQGIGEGRWASGEGRKVKWNSAGDEFAVGFEKGAVVFGMDSIPRCRVVPAPSTKLHQLQYISRDAMGAAILEDQRPSDVLALSTEDARILFYTTKKDPDDEGEPQRKGKTVILARCIGQLGGHAMGLSSRIKDFEVLRFDTQDGSNQQRVIVTGSSDGSIRIWLLDFKELGIQSDDSGNATNGKANGKVNGGHYSADENSGEHKHSAMATPRQVGRLLGAHQTGNRITCLKSFVMDVLNEDTDENQDPGHETKDEFDGFDDIASDAYDE